MKIQLVERMKFTQLDNLMKSLAKLNFKELHLVFANKYNLAFVLKYLSFLKVLHLNSCKFDDFKYLNEIPIMVSLQELVLGEVYIYNLKDRFLIT